MDEREFLNSPYLKVPAGMQRAVPMASEVYKNHQVSGLHGGGIQKNKQFSMPFIDKASARNQQLLQPLNRMSLVQRIPVARGSKN